MTTNKFLNYLFGESHVTNGSGTRENFQRIMDRIYETSLDYLITDDTKEWKAICLSGEKYEGAGVVPGESAKEITVNAGNSKGTYYDVRIHRVGVDDKCLKNPFGPDIKDAQEQSDWIKMHEYARSAESLDKPPVFASILIVREDITGRLTFTPTDRRVDDLMLNQFKGEEKKFGNNPKTMGEISQQNEIQNTFEKDLESFARSAGLPFLVTDRARTVDDQVRRLKSKSYSEIERLYSKGKEIVAAMKAGDESKLRSLASTSSRHLKGLAIDIRTKHYNDSQMSTILRLIDTLGGRAVVEPVSSDCWQDRRTSSPKRLDNPGEGKCYGEHIHIDIPEDYTTPEFLQTVT